MNSCDNLARWGFDKSFQSLWRENSAVGRPGRVIADYGEEYVVVLEGQGDESPYLRAKVAGRLRHGSHDIDHWPAIGDFVVVDGQGEEGRIVAVLPRRSALMRKSTGEPWAAQVMAANIDTVGIVESLNRPISAGRLERSLVLAWDSGASPVIILTKSDLDHEAMKHIDEVQRLAMGVPTIGISVLEGMGLEALQKILVAQKTVALMGPSGVGKSTLINYWLGRNAQQVTEVRHEDGRGRHTTTHRSMFQTMSGALVVDIPGIREVGLWHGEVTEVFSDIEQLATECLYRNCQHQSEPGCAVLEAIDQGDLDRARLVQFNKLARELAYIEQRRSPKAQSEARQRWKKLTRSTRQKKP